jgi:hypothetical protein
MSQDTPASTPENEIRILIEEAAKELQIDQLKKELTAKIKDAKSKRSFGSIVAHPAVLLIIGFILTGILGNILTARWQGREWDRQQGRLSLIRLIEQKEKIMEDLTRKVAESDATEEDVLIAFRPWCVSAIGAAIKLPETGWRRGASKAVASGESRLYCSGMSWTSFSPIRRDIGKYD